MRGIALLAVMVSLAASPAWCEGPVSTAPSAAAAPVMPQAAAPGPLGPGWSDDLDAGPPMALSACARNPLARGASDAADTAVHGQVDVGVGTDGYRHVGVYACKPVGGGSVAISVDHSETHWGGRR